MPTLRDQLFDARHHLARAHAAGAERAVAALEQTVEYLEARMAELGEEVPRWE